MILDLDKSEIGSLIETIEYWQSTNIWDDGLDKLHDKLVDIFSKLSEQPTIEGVL